MARQVQPPSSGNPSLPAIASGATQFSADAIPQAAFLDRVAEWRHVRQSLQDEARCAAAIAPIERGIDLAQKPGKTVTLLDKVIELGIAARNRRRIAANLGGKRRPDAGEPALKLARENVDSIRVDRAGRCRMRHDHVGWMAGAAKQSSARLLADMMHGFDRKLKSEYRADESAWAAPPEPSRYEPAISSTSMMRIVPGGGGCSTARTIAPTIWARVTRPRRLALSRQAGTSLATA